MSDAIQILLVDDHPMVRLGVRTFLESQVGFEIVGEAGSASEAVSLVADLAPDVVVLDILMPGEDGITAARRIKAASPSTRLVALTSSNDDDHVLAMVSAGASAYLMKDVEPSRLAESIHRVSQGEVVLEARVAALMVRSIQQPESDLTVREVEVLRLVAQGLTNGEIAARLVVSDKTIKTHVSNILAKLQLSDRTQAAVYAWKQGLLKD